MAGKIVSKKELAAFLGVSLNALTIWKNEGMPCSESTGGRAKNRYNTAAVVQWWIRRETKGGLDLEAEKAKLAKAQAEGAELRNLQTAGSVIELEAACSVAQRAAFAIRQRILGLSLPESEKQALLTEINGLGETDFAQAETDDDDDQEAEPDGGQKAG